MYRIVVHKQFVKDLKKVDLNHNSFQKLLYCISLLSNGLSLPPEMRDHPLIGNFKGFREFHIAGDLLVIYRIDDLKKEVELVRIGTHSQLFK
ncbi:MAG: type II toxin-antitoxin system YafQ family toxin [Hydrogenothermaceae bacterium]|nr:type II toxin-antitoxin system YafQ family toxin [Hydrogenothermaceae bacterium]